MTGVAGRRTTNDWRSLVGLADSRACARVSRHRVAIACQHDLTVVTMPRRPRFAGAGYSPGRVPRLDQPDGAASSPGEPAGWRPGLVSCIPGWTMNAPEPGRSCPPSPCAQGTIRTTPGVLP